MKWASWPRPSTAWPIASRRCSPPSAAYCSIFHMSCGRLWRALENVIRKAIRPAPVGTAVEVAVRGRSISVRDYGPGVKEPALARIFDPFYRVENDRDRSSGGVGLGLAIARRAVELHKGSIR